MPVCPQLPLPYMLQCPPVVVGAMQLLQPHHAEVCHFVSVSVSAPPLGQRAVCRSALVERVAGLPDIKVCPGPLTNTAKTRFDDLQSTLFLTVILLPAASSNESASIMYGQIAHLCAPHGPLLFGFRKNILLCFCALKCPPGWHLFCVLQAGAPETHS